MSIVIYIMLGSGMTLLGSVLLFRTEAVGGRRLIFRDTRLRLDRYLESDSNLFLRIKRFLGTSSLRLLLHYVLHQILSIVLLVVGLVEARLHRLKIKNKVVAKVIRAKNEETHLSRLVEEKRTGDQSGGE